MTIQSFKKQIYFILHSTTMIHLWNWNNSSWVYNQATRLVTCARSTNFTNHNIGMSFPNHSHLTGARAAPACDSITLSWLPPCNALAECLPIDPKLHCTSMEWNWVSSLEVLSVEPHSKVNWKLGIFLSYCGLLLGCGHCVWGSLQSTLWPSNLIRVTHCLRLGDQTITESLSHM